MFKSIYIKIDDKREKIEDFIADNILNVLDDNPTVDSLEKKAILAAFEAADAYLMTYGVPSLPDEIKEKIADATIKGLSKANKLLQKQLKKKSRNYIKRQEVQNND